jgi:hypothetical protein
MSKSLGALRTARAHIDRASCLPPSNHVLESLYQLGSNSRVVSQDSSNELRFKPVITEIKIYDSQEKGDNLHDDNFTQKCPQMYVLIKVNFSILVDFAINHLNLVNEIIFDNIYYVF